MSGSPHTGEAGSDAPYREVVWSSTHRSEEPPSCAGSTDTNPSVGAEFPTPVGEPAGHAVPGQRARKNCDRTAAENRLVSRVTMLPKGAPKQSQREAGEDEEDEDIHDKEKTMRI